MFEDKIFTINKRYFEFEDISKNKTILREIQEMSNGFHQIVHKQVINYHIFRDKLILSKLSVRQLKNLIKRCEEVIQDKESGVL